MTVEQFYAKAMEENRENLRPVSVSVSCDEVGNITSIQVTYKPIDMPVMVPSFLTKERR